MNSDKTTTKKIVKKSNEKFESLPEKDLEQSQS